VARAIGDHLDAAADRFGLCDPVGQVGVQRRLADAAEEDRRFGIEVFDAGEDARVGSVRHAAQRLGPVVAVARHAIEVAVIGRLHVEARQLRGGSVQPHDVVVVVHAHLGARHQSVLPRNLRRQNQPALFVHFGETSLLAWYHNSHSLGWNNYTHWRQTEI
jgi:hypothetical protein